MAEIAPLHIIILAAGKGTRMQSSLPKVLHEIGGKTMLARLLATANTLRPTKIHIVVGGGTGGIAVRGAVSDPDVVFHVQDNPLGSADAAQRALQSIGKQGICLILLGDVPFVRAESLSELAQMASIGSYANLTMRPEDTHGYGRIVRDDAGNPQAIVSELDATETQRSINECDAGPAAMPIDWLLQHLPQIKARGRKKERMMPALVAAAALSGLPVRTLEIAPEEAAGINSPAQKTAAESWLVENGLV